MATAHTSRGFVERKKEGTAKPKAEGTLYNGRRANTCPRTPRSSTARGTCLQLPHRVPATQHSASHSTEETAAHYGVTLLPARELPVSIPCSTDLYFLTLVGPGYLQLLLLCDIRIGLPMPVAYTLLHRLALVCALITLVWNIRFVLFIGYEESMDPLHKVTTILIWDWPFHKPMNVSGDVCAELYNIKNCRLTADRNIYNHSDVVVFHHKELGKNGCEMPSQSRPAKQMWVWANLESPSNTNGLEKLSNVFNWTLTYREDSDIFVPYGQLVPKPVTKFHNSTKTGLVAWVVSNYHRSQERALFFKEFSSYLKVDVYGKASNRTLCSTCLIPTLSRYFFYLALENSVHQDYITEKLWQNSFLAGTVPVVLGPPRENYEKFIPADSFIHVSDFLSPKHLADFLVSMTPQRYQEFFRWRETYGVKVYMDWRQRFCTIGSKYPGLPKTKTYSNLEGWFNGAKHET
ncbi:alpha-(1,3)-fucosyltransferase 7 [Pseudophryne corroboree]|uniref:alpha-(1,3)-fucosyltransferase 7 n=1 Tax=Pseudophryne corroboree TaxID=495146 RepID=UPI00308174F9